MDIEEKKTLLKVREKNNQRKKHNYFPLIFEIFKTCS